MGERIKDKIGVLLGKEPVMYLHASLIFFLNDTSVPSLDLTAQLSKFSEEFEQGSGEFIKNISLPILLEYKKVSKL